MAVGRKLLTSAGVSAARNAELMAYQRQLREARVQYREEFRDQPTKSEQAAQTRAAKADVRNASWNALLHNIKGQLKDPQSTLYHDSHPCRPMIRRPAKSDEARKSAERALSEALAPHQMARRRAVAMLAEQLDLVTKENLEARIQEALANPINYNLKPETMAQIQREFRRRLAATQVSCDEIIRAVEAPANPHP